MAIGKIARRISGDLPSSTQEYIANSETMTPFDSMELKDLTLDDLALRYKEIEQQSQIFKGQILLEARERFQSNIEFGEWLSVNFTELNSSNTGKLINLAKFFQGERSLNGIPVSAGYLLSAPSNKGIAAKVYDDIKGKKFKLDEIKEIIASYKNKTIVHKENTIVFEREVDKDVLEFSTYLLNEVFKGKSKPFIQSVLSESLLGIKDVG